MFFGLSLAVQEVCDRVHLIVSKVCGCKEFCQVKKIKNLRKTGQWVGGSILNSDLFFGNFVFLCFFFVVDVFKNI